MQKGSKSRIGQPSDLHLKPKCLQLKFSAQKALRPIKFSFKLLPANRMASSVFHLPFESYRLHGTVFNLNSSRFEFATRQSSSPGHKLWLTIWEFKLSDKNDQNFAIKIQDKNAVDCCRKCKIFCNQKCLLFNFFFIFQNQNFCLFSENFSSNNKTFSLAFNGTRCRRSDFRECLVRPCCSCQLNNLSPNTVLIAAPKFVLIFRRAFVLLFRSSIWLSFDSFLIVSDSLHYNYDCFLASKSVHNVWSSEVSSGFECWTHSLSHSALCEWPLSNAPADSGYNLKPTCNLQLVIYSLQLSLSTQVVNHNKILSRGNFRMVPNMREIAYPGQRIRLSCVHGLHWMSATANILFFGSVSRNQHSFSSVTSFGWEKLWLITGD